MVRVFTPMSSHVGSSPAKVSFSNDNVVYLTVNSNVHQVTAHTIETSGDHILAGVPSARTGLPEDVAGTAIYLASRASGYTNGATILIDGGTQGCFSMSGKCADVLS